MAAELEKLVKQFKASGNRDIAAGISAWASVAKTRGIDTFQAVPVPEALKPEITPFTSEQITLLTKEGLLTDYSNTGQTLASLREAGNPFWSTWHKDYPDFEALASKRSAVAFNPDNPFLPKSNKTLDQQLEMIERFNRELQQRVPGVMAILGEAPDYAELAFAHLKKTGRYLFGKEHGYNYTRTQTRVDSYVANVGYFGADCGLGVDYWSADGRGDDIFAAPLVVPISGTK